MDRAAGSTILLSLPLSRLVFLCVLGAAAAVLVVVVLDLVVVVARPFFILDDHPTGHISNLSYISGDLS